MEFQKSPFVRGTKPRIRFFLAKTGSETLTTTLQSTYEETTDRRRQGWIWGLANVKFVID